MSHKILIIDGSVATGELLSKFLTRKGYQTSLSFSGANGLVEIKKVKPAVVLCDLKLPDFQGTEILKKIKSVNPHLPIVVVSDYSDVKIAVKAIKSGAYEYVTKPIIQDEILFNIQGAIKQGIKNQEQAKEEKKNKTEDKADHNQLASSSRSEYDYINGKDSQAKKINKLIKLVAPTKMTTMILGESGTGKEVAARQIHTLSKRKDKPFVAVDCGALPDEIAGSELFGHIKGSFTGAVKDRKGYFEQANKGTLFLDEIGNLSYENQVKLLRVLQERKVRRIGGTEDIPINVRVIVATNEDLKDCVRNGDFREDLYYRINEFKIELPQLRHRGDDIFLFANYFLEKSNWELGKNIEGFTKEVKEKFKGYHWPGNIRELRNVVKRATLLEQGDKITLSAIPEEIIHPNQLEEISDPTSMNFNGNETLREIVEKTEKNAIIRALETCNYNKSKCANILDVDRKTLYNKINHYNINI